MSYPRDHVFDGEIGYTIDGSIPSWPESATADGRKNLLLIILDDTGWSDLGCYGSEIATPAIDALAADGVRFNRFHVTPLCSPTRASVMTGRNHHAVGMRFLADADTGYPNSRGFVRRDVPMLPELLREDGYGTYLVGKWHLAPLHELTPGGPYQNWPLARGFDRFYGFLDGCTDQYEPELYADNHRIDAPRREGYHLSEDLAEQSIGLIRDHLAFRQGAPFFLQLALGATHAPFQAPREYIEPYREVFAKGWDRTRADRLERQQALGLVPAGTQLTARNAGVAAWDELDADAREVYTSLQAAFAGFLEHADAQIGRVMAELRELGIADDTIVVVMSDNGASREGREHGDVDANAPYSGLVRPPAEQLAALDELGGPLGGAHYPEGWAMAGNTPFRLYKQFVDLGGSRAPLVISAPGQVQDAGRVAEEFVHAIDLAPTMLELAGARRLPAADGASVAAAVRARPAVTGGRTTQYWEMMGRRAIWHRGWRAVADHTTGTSYDEDRWRLYDCVNDFSESVDVAAEHPALLRELQARWWAEAGSNQVFPLDDRSFLELIFTRSPLGVASATQLVLFPGQHIPVSSAISGSNREFTVTAELGELPPEASGMLFSSGNGQGGYHLYLDRGVLRFEHASLKRAIACASPAPLASAGSVGFHLTPAEDGTAAVELLVDRRRVAEATIPRFSGHLAFWGLDVGRSGATSFSERVAPPFEPAPGVLRRVVVDVAIHADDLEEYAEAVMSGE